MIKSYRPSNGTEGDIFMAQWCAKCRAFATGRDDTKTDPCDILGDTFAYDIDHPHYPPQWITDDRGPRCTAFCYVGDDQDTSPIDHNAVVRPLL